MTSKSCSSSAVLSSRNAAAVELQVRTSPHCCGSGTSSSHHSSLRSSVTGRGRRGSRWLMDEGYTTVNGGRHWLWRAIDEHGVTLSILLQRHRETNAAEMFLTRLLGEDDVPEAIHTDHHWRCGVAPREIPVPHGVERVQVVSTARCNNPIRKRAQTFLCRHASIENLHFTRTGVPTSIRRNNQNNRSRRG